MLFSAAPPKLPRASWLLLWLMLPVNITFHLTLFAKTPQYFLILLLNVIILFLTRFFFFTPFLCDPNSYCHLSRCNFYCWISPLWHNKVLFYSKFFITLLVHLCSLTNLWDLPRRFVGAVCCTRFHLGVSEKKRGRLQMHAALYRFWFVDKKLMPSQFCTTLFWPVTGNPNKAHRFLWFQREGVWERDVNTL